MDKICAVTGSFDPVTIGHVSIVQKALEKYQKVFVLMLINPDKEYLFSEKDRLEMLKLAFSEMSRVEVAFFDGYTYEFCYKHGITDLVRGIRNQEDLEYEKNLSKLNYEYGKLNTVFFNADNDKVDLSSKSIRDKIKNKQSLEGLVPKQVIDKIKEIINNGWRIHSFRQTWTRISKRKK